MKKKIVAFTLAISTIFMCCAFTATGVGFEEEIPEVVEVVEEVVELTMPKEVEPIETWQFTIKATKTQAKEIKEFILRMKEENVEYKKIKEILDSIYGGEQNDWN